MTILTAMTWSKRGEKPGCQYVRIAGAASASTMTNTTRFAAKSCAKSA